MVDRRDSGVAVPLVVLSLGLILIGAALAVDIGRVTVAAREARTVADIAALDSVRLLDPDLTAQQQRPAVTAEAMNSAERNGAELDPADVRLGRISDGDFTAVGDSDVPTAVEVTASDQVRHIFRPGTSGVSRAAVATNDGTNEPIAAISAASGLASAELLDGLLAEALGIDVALFAVGWGTLADAGVGLGELAAGVGLDPAAVDELLDTVWGIDELVVVLADVLPAEDQGALAELLSVIGLATDPATVRLADYLELVMGSEAARQVTVTAGDLLGAAIAAVAADEEIDVALELDGINLGVADVAVGTVTVGILEPPQVAVGPAGTYARTAQVVASVELELLNLNVGGLVGARLNLPLNLTLAGAEASITEIACTGAAEPSEVVVTADTAVSQLGLHPPGNPSGHAPIAEVQVLGLLPVTVTANALVDLAGASDVLVFGPGYPSEPEELSFGGGDPGALLVGDISLGGGLVGEVLGVVTGALDVAAPVLDAVVPELLEVLGAQLGAGSFSVPMASCPGSRLVR